MGIIIDIVLVAVLVLSVWSGYRRGLVRSVMGMLSFLTAALCGYSFYKPLSDFYNEKFMLSTISDKIYNSIRSIIVPGIESLDLYGLINEKPPVFFDIIDRFRGDMSSVEAMYYTQADRAEPDIIRNISSFVAQPTASGLSNILAFLTIFVAALIIMCILTALVDTIFKLPVLNTLNRLSGTVLGVVIGCGYVWLLCAVINASLPLLSSMLPAVFDENTYQTSLLLKFMLDNNLINVLLK